MASAVCMLLWSRARKTQSLSADVHVVGMGSVDNHNPLSNKNQLLLSTHNMAGTLLSVHRLYLIQAFQHVMT